MPVPQNMQAELAKLYKDTSHYKKFKPYKAEVSKIMGFPFDPNKISQEQFLKLGLRPKLVKTIINYRSKGGRFYRTEDLQKIWGMRDEEYAQLKSWVRIPKTAFKYKYKKKKYSKKKYESKKKEKKIVFINQATAEELKSLYGIGDKLSSNILKYREMLGGFANIEQLKEVYGISAETFSDIKSQLKVKQGPIKKININEATYYEMRSHPYLREHDLAKAINQVRRENDYTISTLDQLLAHDSINEQKLNKIAPYLRLE